MRKFTMFFGLILGYTGHASTQIGNGGIDVISSSGRAIPIETYIDNLSDPIESVCTMNDQFKNRKEWEKALNNTLAGIHKKYPLMAWDIYKTMNSLNFYFLRMDEGVKINFTDDDGRVISTFKENGAIKIQSDIYFSYAAWADYEETQKNIQNSKERFQLMLTRLFHETLLSKHSSSDNQKYNLGKGVVELLRLSDVYEGKGGHSKLRLKDKDIDDTKKLLSSWGLSGLTTSRYYYLSSNRYSFNSTHDRELFDKYVAASQSSSNKKTKQQLVALGLITEKTRTVRHDKKIEKTFSMTSSRDFQKLKDFEEYVPLFLKGPFYLVTEYIDDRPTQVVEYSLNSDFVEKEMSELKAQLAKPPVPCP